MTDDPSSDTDARGKVARLIDEHDAEDVGEALEHRWTSNGYEGMSLRELEAYFNEYLLEQRMRSVGMQSIRGEVSNIYRLLTDDEVSRSDYIRAKRRLERSGVDVEQLEREFVSYQSIRTYLREVRGAEYRGPDTDPKESACTFIRMMESRTASVVENKLDQFNRHDDFAIPEPQVIVNADVICGECSAQYSVQEVLESSGCECQEQ
jgi:hypothetical protein